LVFLVWKYSIWQPWRKVFFTHLQYSHVHVLALLEKHTEIAFLCNLCIRGILSHFLVMRWSPIFRK
jgi:hypothetical protein